MLSQNGYVVTHEEQKGGHHIRFVKNGIAFELHRKPNGITADDGRMTDLMEEGLSHIEMHQIRGYDIPVLPKTQNGLVLLLHIMKHIKSGLGFRQIIDWMMYVDKNLDDTYYGEYKDILETIGLKDFAVTVTGFCQIYLGLRRDITWCSGADESVCSEFLEYLSEQGNFGRKKVHVDKGAKVLASERNIFDFIRFLQRAGCINWKLAQEKPALKIFAWAYQCRKYIKIVLSQERPMDYLKYSFSEGQKKQEFYQRLGIDKVKV